MGRKRDTFIAGRGPYYPEALDVEAAKYLANVARRYAQRKATIGDVDAAIAEWQAAVAEERRGGRE